MRDDRGLDAVRGLSMDVRAGEIVGIAGVDGNGQSELIQALAGMRVPHGGHIELNGVDVTRANPRESSDAGVGHIPEDRQRHGLVLDFSIAENTALHDYDRPPMSHMYWLDRDAMVARAADWIQLYDVRGGGPPTPARALSGGNQQKVVLAREIQSNPRLLIAAQPTRGLDVGAIEYVHRRLVEQRDAGCAVLLVSFELDEVLDLADRILVMYGGQIVLERASGADRRARARRRHDRRQGAGVIRRALRSPSMSEFGFSLLTVFLALIVGGLAMAFTGANPLNVYKDLVGRRRLRLAVPPDPGQSVRRRAAAGREQPRLDARAVHAARAHRLRGRVRVPLRALQHRRHGPVLGRIRVRAARGPARRRAGGHDPRRPSRPASAARSGPASRAGSRPTAGPTR